MVFMRFLGPSPMDFSTLLLMMSCIVMVVLGAATLEELGDAVAAVEEPDDDLITSKNASASFMFGSGSSLRRWIRHWCFCKCAFCLNP